MINLILQRHIRLLRTLSALNRTLSHKIISIEVDHKDVIDVFTSKLVQNKSNKWETFKLKKKGQFCNLFKPKQININIAALNQEELKNVILEAIENDNHENVAHIIKECCNLKRCPSITTLLFILDVNSRKANIEIIEDIKELVSTVDHKNYINHGEFNHYLAEAFWIKGDVIKALEIYEKLYKENVYMRRRIRIMLKFLILDITNRSEAALFSIIRFSENILKEFNDYHPLVCIWQACFLSEWFSDQTLALKLLEKYDGLFKAVISNLPNVVSASLRNHQTEIVYRLLEVLLKYEMKMQYSMVLVALFDYKYRAGDTQSCSEILDWAVKNNITLPSSLHQRFLMLLLHKSDYTTITNNLNNQPTISYKF